MAGDQEWVRVGGGRLAVVVSFPLTVGIDNANRVYRGGNWNSTPQRVRAAYRNANHPGNRWNDQGFRAVSSPERWMALHGTGSHRSTWSVVNRRPSAC